ncbi:hypothetical protein FB459_0229 [Yimella lutea]|uniref:Uncharacterized protein n=1 Tax=Yimella lutea TaxID=587872 RepID=A0A542EC18_9MICO|nr:hypothetical protein FB459_0229 [Yimella lutea]
MAQGSAYANARSTTSASRTHGIQRAGSMCGNANSSSNPPDFQPSPVIADGLLPDTNRYADPGVHIG